MPSAAPDLPQLARAKHNDGDDQDEGALAANPRLKFIQTFRQHTIWDGDVGLFDVHPDIEWYAVSDNVYLYQLLR